ncbi:MAG: HD domain-containing protein [Candidatus Pacebacteria bacterium]|nr:HD domain-containing protein [Candidatus Paceibacterota bacterium]
MISKKIINQIEKEAKKYFINASGCHDWTHIERVRNLALKLGKKEGANLQILEIAVLLHDIGRKQEMKSKGKFCHAEIGVKESEKILKKYKLNNEIVENILHCVLTHRYRNNNIPETIEARVLFDADKIDLIGAVGIARNFLFAGNSGSNRLYTGNEQHLVKSTKNYSYTKGDSCLLEYELILKNVRNKLLTKSGKEISKSRDKFTKEFFRRFKNEINAIE